MSLFATGLGVMGLFRQRSPGHVPGFFLGAMLHRMRLLIGTKRTSEAL
jgi:hypothetical protein